MTGTSITRSPGRRDRSRPAEAAPGQLSTIVEQPGRPRCGDTTAAGVNSSGPGAVGPVTEAHVLAGFPAVARRELGPGDAVEDPGLPFVVVPRRVGVGPPQP